MIIPMRASRNAITLLKRFEGFSATPYLDVAGYSTIGYGHCIKPGEKFESISEQEAEELLINDLAVAERCIQRLVKAGLSQNQFDALASFIYNVGARAFENSTLLKMIDKGDMHGAALQFDRWVYAGGRRQPGLITRRRSEKNLFYQDVN